MDSAAALSASSLDLFVWQWQLDDGEWEYYLIEVSEAIEEAYLKYVSHGSSSLSCVYFDPNPPPSWAVSRDRPAYILDFSKLPWMQVNTLTSFGRRSRRVRLHPSLSLVTQVKYLWVNNRRSFTQYSAKISCSIEQAFQKNVASIPINVLSSSSPSHIIYLRLPPPHLSHIPPPFQVSMKSGRVRQVKRIRVAMPVLKPSARSSPVVQQMLRDGLGDFSLPFIYLSEQNNCDESDVCSVCLDSLTSSKCPFTYDSSNPTTADNSNNIIHHPLSIIQLSSCSHKFHLLCIQFYFFDRNSRAEDGSAGAIGRCPLCNQQY